MRQKQILLACAVLIACVLGGCGGGEKAATGLPESYTLGDETVAALPAPEGAEVTDDTPTIYTYTGLESPGTVVQAYVLQLTNEQNGFSVSMTSLSGQMPLTSMQRAEPFFWPKTALQKIRSCWYGSTGLPDSAWSQRTPPKAWWQNPNRSRKSKASQ